MKKITSLIFALILIPSICSAAFHANTQWEYDTATGNDANGGGYVILLPNTGTDMTYPTSSPQAFTDWVIGAVDNTTATSVAHAFTTADVGNIANITAGTGWTVQRAQIISVAGVIATFDKALGTAASIGGTGNLGGAFALPSDALLELGVAGNTHWIKSGTYTLGGALSIAAAGSAALPINLTGYITNRTTVTNGTDRPTIAGGTNAMAFAGINWKIKNIIFTTTHTNGVNPGTNYLIIENCKITQSGAANKYGIYVTGSYIRIINNEIISTSGYGIGCGGNYVRILGNYIHDSNIGIYTLTGVHVIAAFNIIDTMATGGILNGATYDNQTFWYNTIYGAETPAAGSYGLSLADGESMFIFGNIIYGWETPITLTANALNNYMDYNVLYNNTNAVNNITLGPNDIATNPTFTDAPNGNFTVGTNMKAKAFPGTFPGGLSTGYLDIGAVQRVEPAASGGGGAWGF